MSNKKIDGRLKYFSSAFLMLVSAVQADPARTDTAGAPPKKDQINVAAPIKLALNDQQLAQFDPSFLKFRGISPQIAEYFRLAARFAPGDTVVEVSINGALIGRRPATFGNEGTLCFTPAFIQSVGLIKPEKPLVPPLSPAAECPAFDTLFARTVVTLDPTNGAVDITTPADNIELNPVARVEGGGRAALLNYRLSTLQSSFAGSGSTSFTMIDSLAGFNWDDWIVRSQQSYSSLNGQGRGRFAGAYAQKTFVDDKQILQGGWISTQSPLYGGVPFAGVQWVPESALIKIPRYPISGVAATRARVEVKQNGIVLLSTVVPPGPFSLTEYQQASLTADLQVKVTGDNGAEENFVVPASSLLLAGETGVSEGIYASAGMLWDASQTNDIRSIPMVTAAKGWKLGPGLNLTTGGLFTTHYGSVGGAGSIKLDVLGRVNVYGQILAAVYDPNNSNGAIASSAVTWSNSNELQVGVSGNLRTAGYRSVQEAESRTPLPSGAASFSPSSQIGANLRWNSAALGSFTAGLTHQNYFGTPSSDSYSFGWNSTIGIAHLSISFTHNTLGNVVNPITGATPSGNNYIYASLNLPLGPKASFSSYVRQTRDSTQENTYVATTLEHQVNSSLNYRVTAEKSLSDSGLPDMGIAVNAVPRYTNLSFGASYGPGRNSYYAEASGGIVVSSLGPSFSPFAVQDTFAVVKLGDVAGIELQTPSGNVWSGYNGLAAIPGLLPFHNSRVEIEGESLPTEVDIDQGIQVVQARRGAVVDMTMKVTKVRRVLLTVKYQGSLLPAGLAIVRNQKEFFTASSKNGFVMMADLKDEVKYSAQLSDEKSCTFQDIKVNTKVKGDAFERGTAVCE